MLASYLSHLKGKIMSIKKKYEPKSIGDIVVEDPDTKQRLKDYAEGARTGHVLLHGPIGTGKSAAARVISDTLTGGALGAFTKAYEGADFNQSDFDKILNEWSFQHSQGVEVPVTVINEVDLLSPALLEKLKAFMDENGHLGQIVATTNNPHRLSPAQQDRFDVIEMPPISADAFAPRVREILAGEGVHISDDALRDVLATTNGSWRDGMSAVEDIVLASKRKPKP